MGISSKMSGGVVIVHGYIHVRLDFKNIWNFRLEISKIKELTGIAGTCSNFTASGKVDPDPAAQARASFQIAQSHIYQA